VAADAAAATDIAARILKESGSQARLGLIADCALHPAPGFGRFHVAGLFAQRGMKGCFGLGTHAMHENKRFCEHIKILVHLFASFVAVPKSSMRWH